MGGSKQKVFRKNRDSVARRRWLVGGLAVFLLFDVGLVGIALTSAKPAASAGLVAEATSSASPAAPVASESPTLTSTPTPVATSASFATVPPTRVLAALDGSTVWRALTGPCPATTASPQRSTDSGVTWKDFDASVDTDASSILGITVSTKAEISLVTLDAAACVPQLVKTFVSGDQWKAYPDRVATHWFVNPSTRGVVHTPTGDTFAAQDDSSAAVLCEDASIHTTTDAGGTWSAAVSVPGASAIAATGSTTGYAVSVVNPAGCTGAALATVSSSGILNAATTKCLPANVAPGETAMAVSDGGTLWLWAGDALSHTTDGGLTWG